MTGMDAKLIFAIWARALLKRVSHSPTTFSSPTVHAQNSLAAALQEQSEFLPVREAYRLDGALTPESDLRLYWQITEGYYLYQHAFKVRLQNAASSEPLALCSRPP